MIYANSDTRALWSRLPRAARARTLASDRFLDFPENRDDKEWRHATVNAIKDGATLSSEKLAAWQSFVLSIANGDLNSEKIVFARLQSRLMVNMAGGVLENGGLCLDRISGVPFIPGTAVKGCARTAALAGLREWTVTGQKPSGATHPLATAVESFETRESMLAAVALVFGWGDQEWKDDSDFAWACGCGKQPSPEQRAAWHNARQSVSKSLCDHLGIQLTRDPVQSPWKSLPNFAGTVAFLPAYPWDTDPAIEADVVTGHHPDYYGEKKDRNHHLIMPEALDVEEPVPVVFPAVSPESSPVFAFVLEVTPRTGATDIQFARGWLADGLDTFGVGAKTNAGYGWFIPEFRKDALANSEATRLGRSKSLGIEAANREVQDAENRKAEAEKLKLKAEEDRIADLIAVAEAKTKEQWAEDYSKLDDQAFALQAKGFDAMTEIQRCGFVLSLASQTRKATCKRWKDGKQKDTFKKWQEFAAQLPNPITL